MPPRDRMLRHGPGRPHRRLAWAAAILVLAAHAALAVSSLARKSVTNDELAHLPAGLAMVATGEARLNPEHPPLVKLLAGLAATTLEPELPLGSPAYRDGNQWVFGRQTLFGAGNDHRALLFRGRLPVVALSVLGGLGVFLWSRRRFGDAGGLLSLSLCAFSPTVLAHGRLVTMDAAVAAGTAWTLYLWWRTVRGEGRAGTAAAAGLALGLTLGSKFSGLILLPAMAVVDLAEGGVAAWEPWRRRLARWAVTGAVAALVLSGLYLLAGDATGYLDGLRRLYRENAPDAVYYLRGRFRSEGFPEYFLVALAVKTSLAGLLAIAWGLALAAGRALRGRSERRDELRDDLHLWLPALLWLAVHSALALDLGVRYLLPVYALLFVLAGGIAPALEAALGERGRRARLLAPVLAALLGLAQLSTALAAWPDYLPYFHRLVGGARGGIHWLDDSNLDWGQDLARLAPWLEEKGIDRVRLLYYGAGVPEAYGVRREPMLPSDWWQRPRPGDYVVSAQYLVRGLHQARTEGAASDWLARYRPSDVLGGSLYLFRFPAPPAHDRERGEAGQPEDGGAAGQPERPPVDP